MNPQCFRWEHCHEERFACLVAQAIGDTNRALGITGAASDLFQPKRRTPILYGSPTLISGDHDVPETVTVVGNSAYAATAYGWPDQFREKDPLEPVAA